MNTQYLEAMEWLLKEMETCQARLNNLDSERQRVAAEAALTKRRLDETRSEGESAKCERAKLEQELSQALQAMEYRKDDVREEFPQKRALLERKHGEKEELLLRLEETRKSMAPTMSEIESLNQENAALESEIAGLTEKLQERSGLRRRLEDLRGRLETAMTLKTGFAQKGEFSRALLEENPELRTPQCTAALTQYQILNADLQEKVFEMKD